MAVLVELDLNKDTAFEHCLSKWNSGDKRIQYFCECYEDWIGHIPNESYHIVLKLLTDFCYYDHRLVNQILAKLHTDSVKRYGLTFENTIYSYIKSPKGYYSSSVDYWREYKMINCISKYVCHDDLSLIDNDEWKDIQNIVFIDDCSGTGNTFITFMSKYLDKPIKDKQIILVTVHLMEKAEYEILNYASENNLKIKIASYFTQEKAFSSDYFGLNPTFKNLFIDSSKKMKIPNGHILGYEESEGLFAFYNNTPNNTLGVFRYNNVYNKAPFPRKDEPKPKRLSNKYRKLQNLDSAISRRKYE